MKTGSLVALALMRGKLADLFVNGRDIFKIDPDGIKKATTAIMDGCIVYEAR